MKTKNIFSMAALAIVMAACSSDSDMNAIESQSQKGKVVTLTATISAKSASTRATLTDNGDITGAWELGDEFTVAYNDGQTLTEGKIVSIDANGTATFTAELIDPKENSSVYFFYPKNYNTRMMFDQQDGTLETISKKLYGMSAMSSFIIDGDKASIPGNLHLKNDNCILKMAFSDGNTDITKNIINLEVALQWKENEGTYTDIYKMGVASLSTIYMIMDAHRQNTYYNVSITAHTTDGVYKMSQNNVLLEKGNVYTSIPLILEKEQYNTIQAPDGFKNGGNAFANN